MFYLKVRSFLVAVIISTDAAAEVLFEVKRAMFKVENKLLVGVILNTY